MITVITPTGDRSLAFELCKVWMSHQTVRPDQWIVVDDGRVPMGPNHGLPDYAQYVRREPSPKDPKHTLTLNIEVAIPLITEPLIFIMEDDEYYAPTYIQRMAEYLKKKDVVGIGHAKYYHIMSKGYIQLENIMHASLAQTAFRSSFLPMFAECAARGMQVRWLDDWLWHEAFSNKEKFHPYIFTDYGESLYVGIKGLPGRGGIGIGHKIGFYKNTDSLNWDVLKKWIPLDHSIYIAVVEELRKENYG